jgi:hypothetical protein
LLARWAALWLVQQLALQAAQPEVSIKTLENFWQKKKLVISCRGLLLAT